MALKSSGSGGIAVALELLLLDINAEDDALLLVDECAVLPREIASTSDVLRLSPR